MGIKQIVFSLCLFALFVVCLVFGGMQLAAVNESPQSIADDPSISAYANQLNDTLSGFKEDSDNVERSISNSPLTVSSSLLIIDAIGGVWKTMVTVPITIFNLTTNIILVKIFGSQVGALILEVLAALFILAVVFGILALLSRASPDG